MSTALIIPPAQFCGDPCPPERRRPFEKTNPCTAKSKPTVLIVDDEHLIADTLAEILNDKGFEVAAVYDGRSALEHLREFCPNILITDVVMPGMNGIDLAKSVRAACPATRVVLLSGQAATVDLIARARQQGYSFELWAKPIAPEILLERLREK
jgi:DNA-binding response OmpR family regulator